MIKKSNNQFLNEVKLVHGDNYDYSLTQYTTNNTLIKVICPIHGIFEIKPIKHLNQKQGCKKCGIISTTNSQRKNVKKFIEEATTVHGNKYDYSLIIYKKNRLKVKIICPTHGIFEQTPTNHLKGKGCKFCGGTAKLDTTTFINKALEVHGDVFSYSGTNYEKSSKIINITCPKHGSFSQTPNNFLSKKYGCPKCNSVLSNFEIDILEYLKELKIDCLVNTRKIIPPLELDIYIPTHKIAIELDGLYWHSERFKDNDYHLNKTLECERQGIQLIHIFEDEWLDKNNIIKSRLRNLLKLNEYRIYARKCEIRTIDSMMSTKFLNDNHLQGNVKSSIKIGLFHENELVSLMTFGKRPILNKSEYELLRFCNKLNTSVIGGADRLFKHFLKTYNPNNIISYADRRWSQGNLYEKLGFTFKHNSKPNYYYIIGLSRVNRFSFQKHLLIKNGFDKTLSEHKIMLTRGFYRIYDCGSKVYTLTTTKSTISKTSSVTT
jgi:hypothetical protein